MQKSWEIVVADRKILADTQILILFARKSHANCTCELGIERILALQPILYHYVCDGTYGWYLENLFSTTLTIAQ